MSGLKNVRLVEGMKVVLGDSYTPTGLVDVK